MNKLFIIILLLVFKAEAQQNASALAVADSLFAVGNYSKAISAYQNLSETENRFLKIAKSYEALGNPEKASEFYDSLVNKYPEHALGKLNYAKLLIAKKRFKKGDSLLSDILRDDYKNANILYELGMSKETQNDSTAIAFYYMASSVDKNHIKALYRTAKYYVVKRQFIKASDIIKKGLALNENSLQFLNLKALVNFYRGDYHKAITVYKRMIALGEHTQQLYENLASSYLKNRMFHDAIGAYKELLTVYDDQNPKWHYQLGRSYFFEADIEKAQSHIGTALLILDQPLDEQYLNFAMTFAKQKNFKKALEFLNVALEDNPDNQMALYQLAVATDNYYKDKQAVLNVYQRYLDKHGDKGYFTQLTKDRMKDIREELHFEDVSDEN